MYKEVKIFLEILKFVGNYQRFLSKIRRFSPVLRPFDSAQDEGV